MDELYKKSLSCTGSTEKFRSWILTKNRERLYLYGQMNSVWQDYTIRTYITLTDITAFAEQEQALLDRTTTQ